MPIPNLVSKFICHLKANGTKPNFVRILQSEHYGTYSKVFFLIFEILSLQLPLMGMIRGFKINERGYSNNRYKTRTLF